MVCRATNTKIICKPSMWCVIKVADFVRKVHSMPVDRSSGGKPIRVIRMRHCSRHSSYVMNPIKFPAKPTKHTASIRAPNIQHNPATTNDRVCIPRIVVVRPKSSFIVQLPQSQRHSANIYKGKPPQCCIAASHIVHKMPLDVVFRCDQRSTGVKIRNKRKLFNAPRSLCIDVVSITVRSQSSGLISLPKSNSNRFDVAIWR